MADEEAPKKRKKRKRAAAPIEDSAERASEPPVDESAPPVDESASSVEEAGPRVEIAAPPAKTAPEPEPARFLRTFPKDPALGELVAAFERGDYAFVRTEAPALARATKNEEVRRAALELRRRIDPDRLSLLLIAFAFALLVVLSLYYWTHKHP
ncbi:MAG: hypothetical protein U0414_17490 [Polyangiaceae bacterium]